jgi:hypothetical protein
VENGRKETMRIIDEQFEHALLHTKVRLMVFDDPKSGYLVLEDWDGTNPVRKTVGAFDSKDAALAKVSAREAELDRQRFMRVTAES